MRNELIITREGRAMISILPHYPPTVGLAVNMKMLSYVALIVLLALLYAQGVESFPTGAPPAACDDLTPRQQSESSGHVDPAQTNPLPYIFDISLFNDNGTYQYTPGQTYNCKDLLSLYLMYLHLN